VISQQEIWQILQSRLKPDDWTSLDEIYLLIETSVHAVKDEPSLPWKRNVRNLLQRRKASGDVLWNGKGSYRLAPPPT
jgi:hypothetical protein